MVNVVSIIKVGYLTRKPFVNIQYQKNIVIFLNFLLKHGLIKKYILKNNVISVWLRYLNNQPLMQNFIRISKKGFRKYISYTDLKTLNNLEGTNILILSTSFGYLTLTEALNCKIGGELLYKIVF